MAKTEVSADIQLAKLQDGEALIPKELAEKYTKQVKELQEKNRASAISSKERSTEDKTPFLKTQNKSSVIGTNGETQKPSAKAGHKKPTVAIYSDRNVSWIGVGKISKGYNIVTKDQADKWLTRNHVREATPEEVASEFGL
jgi:hypothetical protein